MSEFENALKIIGAIFSAFISLVVAGILFSTLGSLTPSSGINLAPILGFGFLAIVIAVILKIFQEVGIN